VRFLWLAVLAACGTTASQAPTRSTMSTGIVAHRGASHEAPENTLAALRRAWELGAESCEIDVRVTAAAAAARGFTGVAVHHAAAGDDLVDAVQQAGLVLDVWTVNDAALIARWRGRARWVETDQPGLSQL
jgi:glycerophosphoryl diester phosphodiesterase